MTLFLFFNILAGGLMMSAQFIYLRQVVLKKVQPSLLSWLGWFLLMGVSLWSQYVEYGWSWTLTAHLISTTGCLGICVAAVLVKHFHIARADWVYLIAGLLCMALYQFFSDPWTTTLFAAGADCALAIPTLVKTIKNPNSEKTPAWNMALVCWILTIITCVDKPLVFLVFPIYCLLFNGLMSGLTSQRKFLGFRPRALKVGMK